MAPLPRAARVFLRRWIRRAISGYNTAIVAVNQRAFPSGGIELARQFDCGYDVAANVGGRAPAAFGLLVRQRSGRRVF
jgi:hypothetical protein